MEQKKVKIYPYLIDEKRMAGYYELLLEDNFKVKIFDKKKDKEVYDYFLPIIREYLFWSFDLTLKGEFLEYDKLKNDLKAAVCSRYSCNVFEKKSSTIICFHTGICFAITDDSKLLKDITKYEDLQKMEEINLRSEDSYELKDEKETHKYAYILELYKMIYLKKIKKELRNPVLFDKARNGFVAFTQKLYALQETDKLKDKLKLEEHYIIIENEFDLLYKNSKMNENVASKRFLIALLVVLIIIGVIILGNWIG